jgi:UDP:flavonoid glycosyltransferase YjiC (YdhE family)
MTGTGTPVAVGGPLRVLFSVRPFRGHLHPLIPLARAFERAGHSVAVAAAEDVGEVIVSARLTWFPAGLNPRQVPEVHVGSRPDYGYPAVSAKVEDLLDVFLGQFRPDAVVREPTDLAPIIASEVVGAVNVIYGLARFIPPASWSILGADRTITDLRAAYHLPADPGLECMYRDLYLAVLTPGLEGRAPLPVPAVQPVRYVSWDGNPRRRRKLLRDGDSRASAAGELHRPTVLMTLGTVYNTYTDLFERFLEAVADQDYDVICTLGDGADPAVTDSAPANVRFVRYQPHSTLLPRCGALLCHAGFNTTLGALVAGVPVVCVPLGSDQEHNARQCAARGFGLFLRDAEATPERIRAAVQRVLDEPSFTVKTAGFRDRMQRRPGLPAAVRRVERLVAARKSQGHPWSQ